MLSNIVISIKGDSVLRRPVLNSDLEKVSKNNNKVYHAYFVYQ